MWITNNSLNLQGAIGSETQSPMEFGQNHALRGDLRQKKLSFLNGQWSFIIGRVGSSLCRGRILPPF
jgi:hypothetical protein